MPEPKPEEGSRFQRCIEPFLAIGAPSVQVVLGLLLFLSPLLFEGLTPPAAFTVELLLSILLLFWLSIRLAAPVTAPLELRSLLLPLVGIGVVALCQLVPVPSSLAIRLNPSLQGVFSQTFPLVVGGALPRLMTASPVPGETLHALLRLVLLIGLLIVSRDQLRSTRQRHRTLHILLFAGLVQSALGIVHHHYDATAIFFLPGGIPGESHFFGSFISPNRNAVYLNMIWPIALCMGLDRFLGSRVLPRSEGALSRGGRPPLMASPDLYSTEFYLAIMVPIMLGVILCNSRMGWAILCWSIPTVAALFWARSGSGRRALTFWLVVMAGGAILVVVFWEPLMVFSSQLSQKSHALLRPVVWKAVWRMAQDHPLLGVGLATFDQSFARYNPIEGFYTVLHSDNAYLDILAELGVPGLLLVLICIGVVALRVVRSRFWRARTGQGAILGMLTAFGGLLIHSFVEHTTRGYGTLVSATILLGMLLGALEAPESPDFDPAFRYGGAPRKVLLPILVMPLAFVLIICFAVSDQVVAKAESAYKEKTLRTVRSRLELSLRLTPWSAGPPRLLGTSELVAAHQLLDLSLNQEQEEAHATLDRVPDLLRSAWEYFARAVFLDPLDGYAQRAMSRVAQLRGERALAESLGEDACRVQPTDYRNWFQLARIQAWRGDRQAASTAFGRAILLAPESSVAWLMTELFATSGKNPELAEKYVPETDDWRVPFAFGTLLEDRGYYERAVVWFRKVLALRPGQFFPVSRIGYLAISHNDMTLAAEAATYLTENFPDFSGGYAISAEVLAKQGQIEQAIQSMQKAAELGSSGVMEQLWTVRLLAKSGREDKALVSLQGLEARYPREADIFVARARILWKLNEKSEACDALRKAIEIDPSQEEPRQLLWRIHLEMGGPELTLEAQKELAACAKLARAPRCRYEAARQALEEGDVVSAQRLLEESLLQDKEQADAWRTLTATYLKKGDRQRAGMALENALKLSPTHPETLALKKQYEDLVPEK